MQTKLKTKSSKSYLINLGKFFVVLPFHPSFSFCHSQIYIQDSSLVLIDQAYVVYQSTEQKAQLIFIVDGTVVTDYTKEQSFSRTTIGDNKNKPVLLAKKEKLKQNTSISSTIKKIKDKYARLVNIKAFPVKILNNNFHVAESVATSPANHFSDKKITKPTLLQVYIIPVTSKHNYAHHQKAGQYSFNTKLYTRPSPF